MRQKFVRNFISTIQQQKQVKGLLLFSDHNKVSRNMIIKSKLGCSNTNNFVLKQTKCVLSYVTVYLYKGENNSYNIYGRV